MDELKIIVITPYQVIAKFPSVNEQIVCSDRSVTEIFSKKLFTNRIGYLFFYYPKYPSEILSVSLFNENSSHDVNYKIEEIKSVILEAENLLDGYDELLNNSSEIGIYCIQLLKLDKDWRHFIINDKKSKYQTTRINKSEELKIIENITIKIQEARNTLLKKKDTSENEEDIEIAEIAFENFTIDLLEDLYHYYEKDSQNISYIDPKFETCLEKDTVSFLNSTLMIEKNILASNELSNIFDFTCLGAPLWKSVELELNESVVKFLRYKYGIIEISNPKTSLSKKGSKIAAKSVRLDLIENIEGKEQLKSIMYGDLVKLIKESNENSLKDDLKSEGFSEKILDFISDINIEYSLKRKIEPIRDIRNTFSHCQSMPKSIYLILRNYIIEPELDHAHSVIQNLFELKCEIKQKYNI